MFMGNVIELSSLNRILGILFTEHAEHTFHTNAHPAMGRIKIHHFVPGTAKQHPLTLFRAHSPSAQKS
jgi:hypothetical protein